MHDDEVKTGLVYVPLDANTPLTWRVPKPAPTPVTVQHKCARCEHAFTSPVDAQRCLEAEVAAHQERCFRVGDYVRWTFGAGWCEGRVTSMTGAATVYSMTAEKSHGWPGAERAVRDGRDVNPESGAEGPYGTIRRIPRPEQKVTPQCCGQSMIASTLRDDWHCYTGEIGHYVTNEEIVTRRASIVGTQPGATTTGTTQAIVAEIEKQRFKRAEHFPQCTYFDSVDSPCTCTDPFDTKHDGQALRDLLAADEAICRELPDMPQWFYEQDGLTRTQRQAVSAYRSAELRAKVAASKDAERRRVCVDLGDGEEPW